MNPEIYAKAMFTLNQVGKTAEDIVSGAVKSLKERGALALLPKVLSSFERLVQRASTQGARLTVANQSDADAAVAASKAGSDVKVLVDKRLIGGYRYENGGKLEDNSFKTALLQVYRNATKA